MAQGWQRIDSNGTATDEIFGRSMASFFLASCSLLALWLVISAMDSIKGLHVIWPFACEQCSVAGGLPDMHCEAKDFIRQCKDGGLALPDIVAATRQHENSSFRKAVFMRLADRLSCRNPLKLAFQTEAKWQ